jgi:hypothetical protein
MGLQNEQLREAMGAVEEQWMLLFPSEVSAL